MANGVDPYDKLRHDYPAILTAEQVAEILTLNIRTVYAMAQDGRLPASRLPGARKFHFRLEEIINLLETHRVTPTGAPNTPPQPEPTTPTPTRRATPRATPTKQR